MNNSNELNNLVFLLSNTLMRLNELTRGILIIPGIIPGGFQFE